MLAGCVLDDVSLAYDDAGGCQLLEWMHQHAEHVPWELSGLSHQRLQQLQEYLPNKLWFLQKPMQLFCLD